MEQTIYSHDNNPLTRRTDGHTLEISSLQSNRLLGALPKRELKRLEPHFNLVAFEQGQILLEPGQAMQHIYFPLHGLISLSLNGMDERSNISVVGRDGMVGTVSTLGTNPTFSRAKIEIAGNGVAIPAQVLRREFIQGGELQELMLRHLQVQIVQVSQSMLCVRSHQLQSRFAYWLLLIHDEVMQPTIKLGVDFFAHLLHATYTETVLAAAVLWQHGMIRFKHDEITILDRSELERCSCPCYGALRDAINHLDVNHY